MTASVSLLPPGASPTALTLPPLMRYDEWASLGQALGRMGRAVQWWVGDWLLYGEHTYGEKFAQAATETGFSPGSLQSFQWVASRFGENRRRLQLPWGHHQVVAGLEPEQADEWLLRAEVEQLSQHELRQRVRALKNGEPESTRLGQTCSECGEPESEDRKLVRVCEDCLHRGTSA